MKVKDLHQLINSVVEEKNISFEQAQNALIQGLIAGIKKSFEVKSASVKIDEDGKEIHLFKQYYVLDPDLIDTEAIRKTHTCINLEEARKLVKRAKFGDILEIEVSERDFTLTGGKFFRSEVTNQIKLAQKENNLLKFTNLTDQIIVVRVIEAGITREISRRQEDGSSKKETETSYRVEIEKDVTAFLTTDNCSIHDIFLPGDRIHVLVTRVEESNNAVRIFLTRRSSEFVTRLLEREIPEINEQIIEIVGIGRAAGYKTKVGVRSNDPNKEAVGTCVGSKGDRINEIVKIINGENPKLFTASKEVFSNAEKVEIFEWSDNERTLVSNSLSPAKVIAVPKADPIKKMAQVIVPKDQLSLAIGKHGSNVEAAAKATKWKIDVKSEEMAAEEGIVY